MKTYLPQIEPRKIVRPNITFGVLSYDLDNAYPQRMLELVGQSPTAKDCWDKRAKYIAGNGFNDDKIGDTVLNGRGLTLNKLRAGVATDKGLFKGFGIQVNYNANYKVVSVNYIPFEDIRIGNTDSDEFKGRYAVYPDWGRRTWKNIYRANITYLDPFNRDPKVIKQQVIKAGGWDKWKGQLYYFNPSIDDYPLIEADSVWEDFETEAGIKIFNNREVTTGFLPSTMLFMQSRREEADNNNAEQTDVNYYSGATQFEKDLGAFQGAKSSQKIIVIEYEDETSKPEFHPYTIQNNDKLFEVTEKSVESRIIKGFSVPNALVTSQDKSGLGDPGSEKKEAIREFNDITAPHRDEISKAFSEILSGSFGFSDQQDWGIKAIPGDIAEDVIGKVAGDVILKLIMSQIPRQYKVKQLVVVYGINEVDAEEMIPNDNEIVYPATNPTTDLNQL